MVTRKSFVILTVVVAMFTAGCESEEEPGIDGLEYMGETIVVP